MTDEPQTARYHVSPTQLREHHELTLWWGVIENVPSQTYPTTVLAKCTWKGAAERIVDALNAAAEQSR